MHQSPDSEHGLQQEHRGEPGGAAGRSQRWAPRPPHLGPRVADRLGSITHSAHLSVLLSACCCPAGDVPSWLRGTLLRNGPGILSLGDTSYEHWFDGMSIMHSFTFTDGWFSVWMSAMVDFELYCLRK